MIPTRKELKLQEFAENVLSILENDKEWSADTTDEIASLAYDILMRMENLPRKKNLLLDSPRSFVTFCPSPANTNE